MASIDRMAVRGEYSSREGIFRGGIHEGERFGPIGIRVDINGQNGAEDFFAHGAEGRIGGDNDCWGDEIALGFVIGATCNNFGIRLSPSRNQ